MTATGSMGSPAARRLRPLPLLVGGLALVQAQGTIAAEWSVSGQVYQQLGYSDNIRLQTEDEASSALSVTAGSVNLRGRTPSLELGLDGEADLYRYFEESDLDTDNELVRGFVTRTGERGHYGLEASFRRDTDIVSFLDAGGERGLDDERRHTFAVSPTFDYLLSPLTQVTGRAEYRKRLYPETDDRIDYSLWSGSLGWHRLVTRRTSLGANLYGSSFDSSRQEAVFLSPQAFVGYEYTDRIDFQFAAGPSFVTTDTQRATAGGLESDSDSSMGYAFDGAAIVQATETTEVQVALSRLLEPGGDDGEAVESTRLRGTVVQRLTPHLRLQLDGVVQRKTAIGDETGFEDRNDASLEPRLRWSLTDQVEVSLNYRLRYREFDQGDDAVSNAVFLRLSYDFPEYKTSW
jgi:hypothetical protein